MYSEIFFYIVVVASYVGYIIYSIYGFWSQVLESYNRDRGRPQRVYQEPTAGEKQQEKDYEEREARYRKKSRNWLAIHFYGRGMLWSCNRCDLAIASDPPDDPTCTCGGTLSND